MYFPSLKATSLLWLFSDYLFYILFCAITNFNILNLQHSFSPATYSWKKIKMDFYRLILCLKWIWILILSRYHIILFLISHILHVFLYCIQIGMQLWTQLSFFVCGKFMNWLLVKYFLSSMHSRSLWEVF
jgi:hypothetical protein